MTQREECGGTYIGVSECTRREEYDGIGGGAKWGVSIYDDVGSPIATLNHSFHEASSHSYYILYETCK